jgi:hypothetical protein
MPFWLVYVETYGIDFLTTSFVIYISKHHHHHYVELEDWIDDDRKKVAKIDWEGNKMAVKGTTYIYIFVYIHVYV